MARLLSIISVASYGLSALFFVISIFVFFSLDIPFVIGDLSGKNAKKAIEEWRANNEKTGNKSFRSSYINLNRDPITGTMDIDKEKTQELDETSLVESNVVTSILSEETTLLQNDEEETALLEDDDQTMLLSDYLKENKKIEILEEVELTDSKDIIL